MLSLWGASTGGHLIEKTILYPNSELKRSCLQRALCWLWVAIRSVMAGVGAFGICGLADTYVTTERLTVGKQWAYGVQRLWKPLFAYKWNP